jgi:hypothetical protein
MFRCWHLEIFQLIDRPLGVVGNPPVMIALPLVVGGSRMSNHRTALSIFAVVLAVVIAVAFATTIRGVDTTRVANNDSPPGVTGLSQPHEPLDSAPGRALQK